VTDNTKPANREFRVRPDVDTDAAAVEVIVKVNAPDYVPAGVQVRAQISPTIFTAVIRGADLQRLENDTGVKSIAVSQTLRTLG
jgi:hypothetical protein